MRPNANSHSLRLRKALMARRVLRNAAVAGTAALALGCLACASSAQSAGVATPPTQYRIEDVEIVLTRYGCLGRCPVYTLTLRGDGKGLYEGRQGGEPPWRP